MIVAMPSHLVHAGVVSTLRWSLPILGSRAGGRTLPSGVHWPHRRGDTTNAGRPVASPSWCRVPTGTRIPNRARTPSLAIPLRDEAVGGQVEGIVGDSDPFAAVEQALEGGGF